jgi:hypothetical protein
VVLADIAARRAVGQADAEAQAARDHHDLAGGDVEAAEFGGELQAPLLRHHQHLAVGVPEDALHRAVGGVEMHRDALDGRTLGVGDEGDEAGDEIGGGVGQRQRVPAQPVGRGRGERAAEETALDAPIGRVIGRGADAVGPGAARGVARHGEGCAGNLLGIEAERRALRRVLADRQGAGERLGGEFVAEAGQVAQFAHVTLN